jgi:hypothetical protein
VRFRTKIFPGENSEVFATVESNEPVEITVALSPRKDAKPQARPALLNLQMTI